MHSHMQAVVIATIDEGRERKREGGGEGRRE